MKIRPVGDELFHADGQAGMTKLVIALCNLARVSKKDGNPVPLLHS